MKLRMFVRAALLLVAASPLAACGGGCHRGKAALDAGDNDLAIAIYSDCLGQADLGSKSRAVIHTYRGIAHYNKREFDQAIADYDEALRLDPSYAHAYSTRGNAYRRKGENDRGIADYDEALRLNPDFSVAYYNRGNAYRDKSDYHRAIESYDEAIRLDPAFAVAFVNRGLAHQGAGQYELAIADYDQGLRLDPRDLRAYTNRGLVYYRKGQYARALAEQDEAIRINPKYVSAYANRARVFAWTNRLDDAKREVDQALSLASPRQRPEWFAIACKELGLIGRASLAEPYCDEAVKLDSDPEVRDLRAFVLWQLGKSAEARKELQKVHESNPKAELYEPGDRLDQYPLVLAQGLLRELGYRPGLADGRLRPETSAAISAFEESIGLARSGVVSDDLIAALMAARPG